MFCTFNQTKLTGDMNAALNSLPAGRQALLAIPPTVV
jgi:hypothetical protein